MDIEIAKNEFLNYTNSYDLSNFNIKRKVDHSLRVMELCKIIAENLNLDVEDIKLAELIGLLHDIGRFEQMKVYNTFNDSISIDHGDLGVKILKDNNYIRKYINEDIFDGIIYAAIHNHNKFEIEEGLSERELLFSKIIRDADKIDILFQATCITWNNSIEKIENEKIKEEDIQPILENRMINRLKDQKNIESPLNHILTYCAFTFDINFKISFKVLKDRDYINSMLNRFNFKDEETKKLFEKVRIIVNTYIDNKQKG